MNSFLSNCAQCGLETEISTFTDGSFLCDECSKLDNKNNKNKTKDSKFNKCKFAFIFTRISNFLV